MESSAVLRARDARNRSVYSLPPRHVNPDNLNDTMFGDLHLQHTPSPAQWAPSLPSYNSGHVSHQTSNPDFVPSNNLPRQHNINESLVRFIPPLGTSIVSYIAYDEPTDINSSSSSSSSSSSMVEKDSTVTTIDDDDNEKDAKIPQCSVCYEILLEPYVGPCGHSVCCACYTKLHSCPKCRSPVPSWKPNYDLREMLELNPVYKKKVKQLEENVDYVLAQLQKDQPTLAIIKRVRFSDQETVKILRTMRAICPNGKPMNDQTAGAQTMNDCMREIAQGSFYLITDIAVDGGAFFIHDIDVVCMLKLQHMNGTLTFLYIPKYQFASSQTAN